MLTDLRGKAVLVTGASTGIGAAVAEAFGALGARVGVHYRGNRDAAEQRVARIRELGGDAQALAADLTESTAVEALFTAFIQRFGRLDVLVNNAGDLVAARPLHDITDEYFDAVLHLNARAVVVACRVAMAHFQAQGGGGAIINTTSVAARRGGRAGSLMYAGAKAFVQNLTVGLAREFATANVRVNAVAPGVIATPFQERHNSAAHLEAAARQVPLGRVGTPADCVGAFLFLASDAMSAYVTGHTLDVNGGAWMS